MYKIVQHGELGEMTSNIMVDGRNGWNRSRGSFKVSIGAGSKLLRPVKVQAGLL